MKKILSLLLVIVLSLTVMVGCDKIPGLDKLKLPELKLPFDLPWQKDEPADDDNDDVVVPAEDANLKAAYDFVHNTVKDIAEKTNANYSVPAVARVKEHLYTVKWTVSDERITLQASEDGNQITVVVPEPGDADIAYTLKFEISNDKGETLSREYSHIVPKFAVNTYAEYRAAEDGDALVVEGVVYGIMSKAAGDSENSVFVQDLNCGGGYYVYQVSDETIDSIALGQTVKVKGNKKAYYNLPEIVDATIEVIKTEVTTLTPTDITEVYKSVDNATDKDSPLLDYVGGYVTIKGVTLLEAGSNGYYYFELNGVKTYFRISSSSNCTTKDEEAEIIENFNDNFYHTADLTGIATLYCKGDEYWFNVMPLTGDMLSNFSEEMQPMPDDVKAQFILDKLTVPSEMVSTAPVVLPLVGTSVVNMDVFEDVDIAWTLAETANATLVDGVLTAVLPESGSVNVTLTVTVDANGAVKTNTFTVAVKTLDILTVTEALELATEAGEDYTADKHIVKGIIKSIKSDKYGNMYITDDSGNELYVYGVYSAYGDDRYDALAEAPKVGDTVVLYGILGTYKDDKQMKNAWLLSWEHNLVVGETYDPTCTEDGYTEVTCACGYEGKTNVIPATGHQNTVEKDAIDPTCQAAGYEAGTYCNDCKAYVEGGAVLEIVNHKYENNVCVWCGVSNHTCDFTVRGETVDPSCTEGGYTVYGCSFDGCSKTENRDATDPTGHVNTSEVVTKQPSCHEATDEDPNAGLGEKKIVCSCGHTVETITIDRVDHTPGPAATCTADQVCTVCEKVLAGKIDHTYNDTTGLCTCGAKDPDRYFEMTIPEATEAEDGSKVIVSGTVCTAEAWSTSHGNMSVTIVDADGNKLYIYRLATEVKLGDIITVTGSMGTHSGNRQIAAGATAVITGHDTSYDVIPEYTIEEALDLDDGANVIVTGTVIEINTAYSEYHGNISVTIADDNGTQLYIYRLTGNVALNDVIKVTGSMGTHNGSRQIASGATFEKVGTHTCSTWEGPTCTEGAKCIVCGAAGEAAALGHTTTDGVCGNCGETISSNAKYNKVTSADAFTTGTYILIVETKNITVSTYDGSWIKGSELAPADSFDKATGDALAITLEVSEAGVKIKIGDNYVAPKGGNNNGIKTGEYLWAYEFQEDGSIIFAGTGSDTVYLAYNSGSSGFRAYKTSTVTNSSYPHKFTIYKLG